MVLADSDLRAVLDAYPFLRQAKLLQPQDTAEIARLIHYVYRSRNPSFSPEYIAEEIKPFIKDLKQARIPPHPTASLHIISYYKDSKQYDAGMDYWSWVIKQENNYIDLRVYGAAIELLASYGASLEQCQELYIHGLKRFPQDFNEYHMSPGAILPQLDQPVKVRQSSMVLLQGMIKACLMHGDWRNAYLFLDTAMRLHPAQVPIYFLRVFAFERPLPEAFQVFCMYCRSGNQVTPSDITQMLAHLSATLKVGKGDNFSLDIALALLDVVHYAAASGAHLTGLQLNILLTGSLRLLPVSRETEKKQKNAEGSEMAVKILSRALAIFDALNVAPNIQTYNAIFAMAGRLKAEVLFAEALQRLTMSELLPNEVTVRCMLTAAGQLEDTTRLKFVWNTYVVNPEIAPTPETWLALAEACKDTEMVEFLYDQMKAANIDFHSINDETSRRLKGGLARRIDGILNKTLLRLEQDDKLIEGKQENQEEQYGADEVAAEIDEQPQETSETQHNMCMRSASIISEALLSIHKLIVTQEIGNLKRNPPARESIWTFQHEVQEHWRSELYNELSVDPTVARANANSTTREEAVHESPTAVLETSTGFRLDELRYKNWKTINDLLVQAEMFEARLGRSVDLAIEQKQPVRQQRSPYGIKDAPERRLVVSAQLQAHLHDMDEMKSTTLTKEEWRDKILALRHTET